MKFAVLGAGVSGLTIGKKLSCVGFNVKIFERLSSPGGLASTRITTSGYIFDIYGGHIFNSKHPEIMDWIFTLLPKENWNYQVRNAKILFRNRFISYPFELSLCELEEQDAIDAAYDFMFSQQGEEPDNFYDWLTWNFGKSIADFYMIPYNTKIWNYPLQEMGVNWMRGKMPLPEKKDILKSLLTKDSSERKMPHSTFYYPLKGGIQTMVSAMAKGLDIECDFEITKITKDSSSWYINGEGPFDYVISTIPLPILRNVMPGLPGYVMDAINDLKYNSLNTFLCKMPKTDMSWIYIPESKHRMHRLGCQGSLTPYATPDNMGSGVVEIIGEKMDLDDDFMLDEKYVPEKLNLIEVLDRDFTEFAYVIHDKNYEKNMEVIKQYFDKVENFDLLGRFANWNYNNMDLCMKDAFKLYESIKLKYTEK